MSRLRDAKKRSASSRRWLERQLTDPYVQEAKRQGYRSRAAFKLIELDDRFRFLGARKRVVDLGAAPGGWTQVAVARCPKGVVVAVDIADMAPVAGATAIHADFLADETPSLITAALAGPADVVLSDMAPSTIGHRAADHLRIVALAEAALAFAASVLRPGGAFVCKVRQGGAEPDLLARVKRAFRQVRHAKPPASRAESPELYLVAQDFRGEAEAEPSAEG